MDDDKLIKMVEERGVIYNRHHPDYKYKKKKQRAFEEIAEALEIPGKKCLILIGSRCVGSLSQRSRRL